MKTKSGGEEILRCKDCAPGGAERMREGGERGHSAATSNFFAITRDVYELTSSKYEIESARQGKRTPVIPA